MKLIEALDQKLPRRNPFIQKHAQQRNSMKAKEKEA